jgi:hypothetical protein
MQHNKVNRITLTDNHRRSVSSSIYVIEKMVNDIERVLTHPESGILIRTVNDMKDVDLEHYRTAIRNIRKEIERISYKYNLKSEEILMSRLINSRKAKIWETINDTTSGKMKGYSEFPKELAAEFDEDIASLSKILDSL